ncbi:MAG: universal stress protein [Desulfobacteraceae bacterium]|nr:universal stress protein [Desulfobacteraceae bacterium]
MRIKKILVPVDGSDHSMKAAEYAIDFVKLNQSELLLLHCHKPFPHYLGEPNLQHAVDAILRKANQLVEPFVKLYKENNIEPRVILLEEPAGKVIAKAAKNNEVDMIIMGSRGLSDLGGLILGSRAHKVLQLAHCPVLIYR